jgi:Ran GTPase-activating protein (RanGAP) involved in mRNA processing and transport
MVRDLVYHFSTASLTKLLVSRNYLFDGGTTILCDALRESKVTNVQELDLGENLIGPDGAKAIAALCAVCGSLTECDLRNNSLGVEGWTIIFNALRDSPTSKITTWDLSNERLGPEIAKPLAEYISVSASRLTRLDVSHNILDRGGNGFQLLRDAVRQREGLVLIDDDND